MERNIISNFTAKVLAEIAMEVAIEVTSKTELDLNYSSSDL